MGIGVSRYTTVVHVTVKYDQVFLVTLPRQQERRLSSTPRTEIVRPESNVITSSIAQYDTRNSGVGEVMKYNEGMQRSGANCDSRHIR